MCRKASRVSACDFQLSFAPVSSLSFSFFFIIVRYPQSFPSNSTRKNGGRGMAHLQGVTARLVASGAILFYSPFTVARFFNKPPVAACAWAWGSRRRAGRAAGVGLWCSKRKRRSRKSRCLVAAGCRGAIGPEMGIPGDCSERALSLRIMLRYVGSVWDVHKM